MEIQPKYRCLSTRLNMIRRTMPQLAPGQCMEAARYLLAAAGRDIARPHPYDDGGVCAALAGFKPAVTFEMPVSSDWRGVEKYLAPLGFRYTNERTISEHWGRSVPVRSGLIWSVAAVGEMYGAPEAQLTGWISGLESRQKNWPGHLLGYADDKIRAGSLSVEVKIAAYAQPEAFLLVHHSLASDRTEADILAAYYRQAAETVREILGWQGAVLSEIGRDTALIDVE